MRNKLHLTYLLFMLFLGTRGLYAQTFDQLKFNSFPDNWSKQLFADYIQLANYTIRGEDPMRITMYRSMPYTGKPDASFQLLWRQYLSLPDTAATPKIRKLFNNDGEILYTGNAETNGPDGSGYYQLMVYFKDGSMQAILLNALSAKAYKPVMYEWLDRFTAVSFVKKKK